MPRLLLTRARAQAGAFAEQVRAKTALEPVIAPMQEMQDLPAEIDLSGILALAFTSKNGVEAFARMSPARLPAYCVGAATAERARVLGFKAVAAAGNAESLKELLPENGVLHLHGQHVRQKLGARQLAIYAQVALPLSQAAQAMLKAGEIDAVALFSPRAAALFAKYLPDNPATKPVLYTLSAAVAQALPAGATARICPEPSARSMLRLLSADFPA